MNSKGFTLVELLAAISVMAIITAIAVPAITNFTNRQKTETFKLDLEKLVAIAESEKSKNPSLNDKNICFSNDCSGVFGTTCIEFYDIETSPNGKEYKSGYVKTTGETCLSDGDWYFSSDSNDIKRGECGCP